MRFADALLRFAAWTAPAERKDWAVAMEAEYLSLVSGRLRWVLGCVAVSIGWRLAKDSLYFVVLFGSYWLLNSSPVFFFEASVVPQSLVKIGLYEPLVHYAVICLVLGVYRPKLVVLSALVLVLVADVYETYTFYLWSQETGTHTAAGLWPWLQRVTIHDAKPLIGISADLGACLGGGLVGRALARAFHTAYRR